MVSARRGGESGLVQLAILCTDHLLGGCRGHQHSAGVSVWGRSCMMRGEEAAPQRVPSEPRSPDVAQLPDPSAVTWLWRSFHVAA